MCQVAGDGDVEYVLIDLDQSRQPLDGMDGLMCQVTGAGGNEYVWIDLDMCRQPLDGVDGLMCQMPGAGGMNMYGQTLISVDSPRMVLIG